MTLGKRLLLAIAFLTVLTTAVLGYLVRDAWRTAEEKHFQARFDGARGRLEQELGEIFELPSLLRARCRHDPFVDRVLVDVVGGNTLDPALDSQVRSLKEALGVDELVLVTGEGKILAAGADRRLIGTPDRQLAARLKSPPDKATLRTSSGEIVVEAHCTRTSRDAGLSGSALVGLIAARHVEKQIEELGKRYGVELTLTKPAASTADLVQEIKLAGLGGISVYGSQPRIQFEKALGDLDVTILGLAGATFAAAFLVAMLFSRGLARPIESLSRQVREVVHGEPKPVKGSGGRELEQLAESFNQTISDLTAMRKRLAATERIAARREIARRVAHEIKNPLAPIRAAVETLRRLRARDDPAFDEYFDEATRTVLDEVARISNIVSEFTRFARLPPPSPAPLDAVEAVRKVVGLHAGGGVPIELTAGSCAALNADRDQLVQVITNLLGNALEAVKGRPDPRIVVELACDGATFTLSVRDNGPGVAPEMRGRLFEPYATTKPEGTGLGLAIVERIVVEHGGEIAYADAPGGGAQFTVVLPLSGPTLLSEAPTSTPLSER